MSIKVILGAQWGDEGKGKLVDVLSAEADFVARYQGGANAGHTVYINGKKHILHLIPSGILRPSTVCLISNGVVFDPESFFDELEFLKSFKIDVSGRLFISERTHIIFPFHKFIDNVSEELLLKNKIGTTGRGIGPAYVDKYNRTGIRLIDLYDEKILKNRLELSIDRINRTICEQYNKKKIDFTEMYKTAQKYAVLLEKFVADTSKIIFDACKRNDSILLEGAQGSLLDIDFGTYPYVTSSNPTTGGAITGTGIPPAFITEFIGVIKAYITRVGSGPFPTEEDNVTGQALRQAGKEFGATTGRPRRCGWFDAVAAQYAVRINGLTKFALTKLDVLENFNEIKICTAYNREGDIINDYPASLSTLQNCIPVYKSFKGWNTNISQCKSYAELPQNAKIYLEAIENMCGIRIKYISVGPERDQIIIR